MMRSLRRLINTRNEGAMLSDPSIAQGIYGQKYGQRVSRTQAATVVELCRASWVSAWE